MKIRKNSWHYLLAQQYAEEQGQLEAFKKIDNSWDYVKESLLPVLVEVVLKLFLGIIIICALIKSALLIVLFFMIPIILAAISLLGLFVLEIAKAAGYDWYSKLKEKLLIRIKFI